MATTQTNAVRMNIAGNMVPSIFNGTNDLEGFIEDCTRYFKICGLEEDSQSMMVKCLISRDILPIYEAIPERNQSFAEKLREAFEKPSSLIGDLIKILNYEKDSDPAIIFFKKIEDMVDKIMIHKWNREELVSYFLIHCNKEESVKREIRLRDIKGVEKIKDVIKKFDSINIEVSSLNAMNGKETFANVLKKRNAFEELQQHKFKGYPENNNNRRKDETAHFRAPIICWTCNEHGHISRECRKQRIPTCYNCKEVGHISRDCQRRRIQDTVRCFACRETGHERRDCPNISCSGCKSRGHLSFQCWKIRNYREGGDRSQGYQGRQTANIRYDPRRRDVAALEGSIDERYAEEMLPSQDAPNTEAPSFGEMIGAMQ